MTKKYSKYKSSGVEWIGDIPDNWILVSTNKVFTNIGSGTTPKSENQEYYDDGVYNWITTSDLNEGVLLDTLQKLTDKTLIDYPTLKFYPSNSIFISMYGGKIGKIGISKFKSYCNQSVCVLPNSPEVNTMYYYYWFLGFQEQVKSMGRGGGQPNINKDMIKEFPVCKLSLDEQLQIVQYLDEKTELIDKLISTKEQKIDLLNQQRTSLITQVITKGLDLKVKMKDSGVEWIGKIPEHWMMVRIGNLSKLITGFPWKSELFDFENGIKIVRGENVSEGFLRWGERTRKWNNEVVKGDTYFLKEGDIIVSMDGSKVGKNYVLISKDDLPLLLHQRMCRIRCNENVSSKFLTFYISSEMFRYYIDITKTDPMIPHITQKDISDFNVSIPCISEQNKIVEYLDIRTKEIDDLVSMEQKKIDLLKEYRQSLISEVITGKIDVRTNLN